VSHEEKEDTNNVGPINVVNIEALSCDRFAFAANFTSRICTETGWSPVLEVKPAIRRPTRLLQSQMSLHTEYVITPLPGARPIVWFRLSWAWYTKRVDTVKFVH